jgi:hypothetical protein
VDEVVRVAVELAAVAAREELDVAPDHPQRLLQVVGGDVGELLEVGVRPLELLPGALPLADLAGTLLDPLLELETSALEILVPLLDLREHLVDRVDEQPELVARSGRGTDRVIAVLGDALRHLDQLEDGLGDPPLEPRREHQCREERHQQHREGALERELLVGEKADRGQRQRAEAGEHAQARELDAYRQVADRGNQSSLTRRRAVMLASSPRRRGRGGRPI